LGELLPQAARNKSVESARSRAVTLRTDITSPWERSILELVTFCLEVSTDEFDWMNPNQGNKVARERKTIFGASYTYLYILAVIAGAKLGGFGI